MSVEANKKLVEQFFTAMSNGTMGSLTAPGFTWGAPDGTVYDGEAFAKLAAGTQGMFVDGIKMTVLGMIAEGSKVAAEATSYAKLTNGRIYNNRYHFLFDIQNGKVASVKEYCDSKHAADTFAP